MESVQKEFDDFLTDCANCPECNLQIEYFCPDHSCDWNQWAKNHYEILKELTV